MSGVSRFSHSIPTSTTGGTSTASLATTASGAFLSRAASSCLTAAETVCGLGERKNACFHAWLDHHRVETFPGTLALIEVLRTTRIKVAVFSSSRNAEAVLRNAGVLDRFDAKVDGTDMAELDLPGKPDPAILHEASGR
jgi:beta-phosphoglucomutase-like phosphatase (HAD superfamily)